ncbi:helix-turn-helix domain-containing protein [Pediococcus argentinicus]|uniref:HTH cro/C1-type domain-containing protein n=1 Tax=Pediococcus argentinicus TaxID=480391 RepID=A0A0R2NHC4_9LACO|nr:helix-turn-helix transcriptional regulator [Pediococcus argentinicus]KRO25207.1 hypothetical protein IV88_GL000334 [Pediococcus argentinicus]NKZ22397.1 helix-turn-helix transcriptional regulator [Pediococcus argentinicus]GEP19465.1 hypothetical protein LSA03_08490 [Pediococcus argentinicus]
MKIGPALKEGREANHLTQEIVSEKLFVTRQTISNWETNRSYPDLDRLVQLCDLYHLSLDDILRGDSDIMEHFKEQEQVSKRTKVIIQVSYWLNIVMLVLTLLASEFRIPYGPIYPITLVINLIYLSSTCGIVELKKYSLFEKIIAGILVVILTGFLGINAFLDINYNVGDRSYLYGELTGTIVRFIVVVIAILSVWFYRNYAIRK